jgi:VanZ family protein
MPGPSRLLHDASLRRHWRALLLALLLAVAWLAFMTDPPDPGLPQGDKANHLLAFAVLAGVASLCAAPGWAPATRAAAGLLVYGGFIEAVQTQLPGRSGEWPDLLADALGIALGLAATALMRRLAPADRS